VQGFGLGVDAAAAQEADDDGGLLLGAYDLHDFPLFTHQLPPGSQKSIIS